MINRSSQKIFKNSLLYSLGTVFSKAVGFFLVPIYTYNMAEAQYGIATTITSFVSTFGIVIMLSLRAAMIRFYNEYDKEQKKRFVGTILTFVMCNALLVSVLLCVLNHFYMPFLFKGVDFFPCVFCGVLSLGIEGVYLVYQSLLQARQDGKRYSINSMVYLFFHGVTVVVFVAFLKMEALGIVLSNFITNLCFAVYGVWSMWRHKEAVFCLDRSMLGRSLKYSLPILPHDMSNQLNLYSVKLIINHFISYAISGLYTLASQFSTILNLVQSSINLAFRPWFIEQMQFGEEGRKQIKFMSCMIMSLNCFCGVGISVFSKEVVYIMADRDYLAAWKMVPVFILAQLISFVYYSHVQTLMYNVKMSKLTFVCSLSGLLVNAAVSLTLIPSMGIYGVLVASIVSKAVLATIAVILSNRAEHVDFGLPKMVGYIVSAAALIGVGTWLSNLMSAGLNLTEIALKVLLCLVAFAIFILPYIRDYKQLIHGLLKR